MDLPDTSAAAPSRSRLWHFFTALLPYAALIFIFAGMGARDLVRSSNGERAIYVTRSNLNSLATECAPVIVAAAGMTLIILTGGIDLSVGSILGVACATACLATNQFRSPALGMILGALSGMVCGVLNGSLIIALRVPPFIVTLGSLMTLRGVCRLLNGKNTSIYVGVIEGLNDRKESTALLKSFQWLSKNVPWLNIPIFVPLAIAVVFILWIVLSFTKLGRRLYAVGSNEEAARLSGVRVGWTKLAAYAIGGLMAGIAGVMIAARLGSSSATTGTGDELSIIAAVVIGGTSLSGGQGTISGCVIGAVLMKALSSACTSLHIDDAYQMVIIGLFLIAAVAVDRLRRQKAG